MFGRKALPVGTLVVILIIALASLSLGYALWSRTLTDVGTVTTGTFRAKWLSTFTDDGGHVDDPAKDVGDEPCNTDEECEYPKDSVSARDPSGPGPNATRYTKAIGHCWSLINAGEEQVLYWGADNTYPSYHCTIWSTFHNDGSVPMMVQARSLNYNSEKLTVEYLDGPACGTQVDPGEVVEVVLHLHVEQGAEPEKSYSGNSSITLVQWNEYDSELCQ